MKFKMLISDENLFGPKIKKVKDFEEIGRLFFFFYMLTPHCPQCQWHRWVQLRSVTDNPQRMTPRGTELMYDTVHTVQYCTECRGVKSDDKLFVLIYSIIAFKKIIRDKKYMREHSYIETKNQFKKMVIWKNYLLVMHIMYSNSQRTVCTIATFVYSIRIQNHFKSKMNKGCQRFVFLWTNISGFFVP